MIFSSNRSVCTSTKWIDTSSITDPNGSWSVVVYIGRTGFPGRYMHAGAPSIRTVKLDSFAMREGSWNERDKVDVCVCFSFDRPVTRTLLENRIPMMKNTVIFMTPFPQENVMTSLHI